VLELDRARRRIGRTRRVQVSFLGVECTGDGDELEEKLDGGWGVSMSVSQGEEISSCTEN